MTRLTWAGSAVQARWNPADFAPSTVSPGPTATDVGAFWLTMSVLTSVCAASQLRTDSNQGTQASRRPVGSAYAASLYKQAGAVIE